MHIPYLETYTDTHIGQKWHINKAIHCSNICNSNWLELINKEMVDFLINEEIMDKYGN